LTEGLFVTQLSSNAGTSVWWIVWVRTNCCFMSIIQLYVIGRDGICFSLQKELNF